MLLCSDVALKATKLQFCRPAFKIAKNPFVVSKKEFSKILNIKINKLIISIVLVDEHRKVRFLYKNK